MSLTSESHGGAACSPPFTCFSRSVVGPHGAGEDTVGLGDAFAVVVRFGCKDSSVAWQSPSLAIARLDTSDEQSIVNVYGIHKSEHHARLPRGKKGKQGDPRDPSSLLSISTKFGSIAWPKRATDRFPTNSDSSQAASCQQREPDRNNVPRSPAHLARRLALCSCAHGKVPRSGPTHGLHSPVALHSGCVPRSDMSRGDAGLRCCERRACDMQASPEH